MPQYRVPVSYGPNMCGFAIIQAPSLEEALAYARGCTVEEVRGEVNDRVNDFMDWLEQQTGDGDKP